MKPGECAVTIEVKPAKAGTVGGKPITFAQVPVGSIFSWYYPGNLYLKANKYGDKIYGVALNNFFMAEGHLFEGAHATVVLPFGWLSKIVLGALKDSNLAADTDEEEDV